MYKIYKKIFSALLFCLLFVAVSMGFAQAHQVLASFTDCNSTGIIITSGRLGDSASYKDGEIDHMTLGLDVSNLEPGTYKAWIYYSNDVFQDLIDGTSSWNSEGSSNEFTVDNSTRSVDLNFNEEGHTFKTSLAQTLGAKSYRYIHIFRKRSLNVYTTPSYCYLGYYSIINSKISCTQPIEISQKRDTDANPSTPDIKCYANGGVSCIETAKEVTLEAKGLVDKDGKPYEGQIIFTGNFPGQSQVGNIKGISASSTGGSATLNISLSPGNDYYVEVSDTFGTKFEGSCKATFNVSGRCQAADHCSTTEPTQPGGVTINNATPFKLCDQITNADLKRKCEDCADGSDGRSGVWTAVGCVKRDPKSIVQRVIEVGLGLGGGICLLMTIAGGFILTTSQGNPKQADEAKEMITSAVIGLLFIIFSVVILQFIGVTIFHIPGFGTTTSP